MSEPLTYPKSPEIEALIRRATANDNARARTYSPTIERGPELNRALKSLGLKKRPSRLYRAVWSVLARVALVAGLIVGLGLLLWAAVWSVLDGLSALGSGK